MLEILDSYVKNESMAGFPDVYRASVTFKKKQGILLLTHNYEGGSQLRSAYVSNFDFEAENIGQEYASILKLFDSII